MSPAKSKKIHKLVENSLSINNPALFNSLGPPLRSTTCHLCGLFGKDVVLRCQRLFLYTFENIFIMENLKHIKYKQNSIYKPCTHLSASAAISILSFVRPYLLLLLLYLIIFIGFFFFFEIKLPMH